MYDYTNSELAQYYYSLMCMTTSAVSLRPFMKNRKTISEFPIRISGYYGEHHSLSKLRIPDFGDNSKSVLELILEEGYEQALRERVSGPRNFIENGKKPKAVSY